MQHVGPGSDAGPDLRQAQLVLVFDDGRSVDAAAYQALRARFPDAVIAGCSTAGSIRGAAVVDAPVMAAVRFAHTSVRLARASIDGPARSREVGRALGRDLAGPGLVHVLVLCDGLVVNGSELVAGLLAALPDGVTVTGGLAADPAFGRTTVVASGPAAPGVAAAVGFYGDRLRVGHGCLGGWDPFGPERVITAADGNVLRALDHESALALYRRYLGEHAAGLPATGLSFPLSVRAPGSSVSVVRTILAVDDAAESLTFAGDMPVGHLARLMKCNLDRLVDGAFGAARAGLAGLGGPAELALLVSCVGRRLVLRSRTVEELESVREVIGEAPMLGFYSLGELSPTGASRCELHNQTMTITAFREL